jgi:hypothetical protein
MLRVNLRAVAHPGGMVPARACGPCETHGQSVSNHKEIQPLDISLHSLERPLKMTSSELADRVRTIVARLRQDEKLATTLGDIQRLGRTEHYQALVFRLGLQDWFCSYCGQFMVQSEHGPMRRTCGSRCRSALSRANGVGWKSQHQGRSPRDLKVMPDVAQSAPSAKAQLQKLLELIRTVSHEKRLAWQSPEVQSRDRALLLFGFMCPIPLSPSGLAALDIKDVVWNPKGLEVVLYRRAGPKKQYVIIPADDDPRLCPVTAVSAWREQLAGSGHSTGPLFVRIGLQYDTYPYRKKIPNKTERLTGQDIARVISETVRWSDLTSHTSNNFVDLRVATPLPNYVSQLGWRKERTKLPASRLFD